MILLVGLGNPGAKYERNRHNVGFMAVDRIAADHGFTPWRARFQGQVAEQVLRSYDFDQLFIGADGIDLERGTTTFNELLGLSRVMADVAREVIVLAEADKIGRRIPNLELPWSSVHTLITDERLSDEARTSILARGVKLICVAVEPHPET